VVIEIYSAEHAIVKRDRGAKSPATHILSNIDVKSSSAVRGQLALGLPRRRRVWLWIAVLVPWMRTSKLNENPIPWSIQLRR
jgi:hypothetical protein